MIFVVTGTQKFPFNRLIRKMDELVIDGTIKDEVFGQIGASNYIPQGFLYSRFLDKEIFDENIRKCTLLITHAGEGSIMTGLLNHCRVIAVPRYEKYGEHVNDHQLMITKALAAKKYLLPVYEIEKLEGAIQGVYEMEIERYESKAKTMVDTLVNFIG